MPTRKSISAEIIVGVSAIFLSLAALIVSVVQTRIAREQQQASVWPYLQVDYQVGNDEFTWAIVNNGVGPALIRSVRLQYRGNQYRYPGELLDAQIRHVAQQDSSAIRNYELHYGHLTPGDVVKSDGELRVARIGDNAAIAQRLLGVIQDSTYRFTVVYADVYGNCWQLDRGKVTALANCPD